MRITLVAPPMPFSGRVPIVPPVLEYLGALVLRERPDAELELVDANFFDFDPDAVDADLVGITSMTPTVTWAYRTADRLRERGVRVVLGGIHASALSEEAARHADTVVVGEAESVIGRLLLDAESGRLEPFYLGERMALDDMPPPLIGRVRGPYRFRAVFTARGCPYRCTFCSVRRFFGDTIRYRPIGAVVEEVAAHPDRVYFNGDDNIWGGDTRRSAELFDALARGAKRHWYGFGDLAAVQRPGGDRMLAAAKDSGLFSVWAGWETDSSDSLSAYSAVPKQGRDREEAIRRIKSHGIEVVLFMVLGGRRDDLGSFETALETAHRLGVQVHPVLLTPLPGTELYEEYAPYLMDGLGWERYTGTHAVFHHPDPFMTPEARERAYYETALRLLSLPNVLRQVASIPAAGFPSVHVLSLVKALPVRRAMKKARAEWRREREMGGRTP